MARLNPNRRILVTTLNTALATAAVTATAVGWAAFGVSDTSSAATAQPDQRAAQAAPPSQQQPFSFGRHRGHHDSLGGGSADPFGQGQPSFGGGSADPFGQGQGQPSFGGGSQFRQPMTSTRSSR